MSEAEKPIERFIESKVQCVFRVTEHNPETHNRDVIHEEVTHRFVNHIEVFRQFQQYPDGYYGDVKLFATDGHECYALVKLTPDNFKQYFPDPIPQEETDVGTDA